MKQPPPLPPLAPPPPLLAEIVMVAVLGVSMVAFPVGLNIDTLRVSSLSVDVSAVIGMLMVLLAKSPSAQLSVPLVAVKSLPDVAVPLAAELERNFGNRLFLGV